MKYIKKVIIENFQSHKYSEIKFGTDLNILVGESDKGKSAVLRALKWVLYNEPRGTDFIKYGANECSVTVVMGDNYTITRKRKKSKNTYIVIAPDGEKYEFENFGNNVPLEVIEATGIKKIKLDTDKESKLNLNEQLDPPFLLSETGTMRAKTIGRIVNTNIIDAAERDILKDISNNNVTIKNIERQLEQIDSDLEQYSNIEQEEKNIKKLDNLIEKLDESEKKLSKINSIKLKLTSINEQIDKNKKTIKNLKSINNIDDKFNLLSNKYSLYQQSCRYKSRLETINKNISQNQLIVNKVKNVNDITNKINDVKHKYQTLDKLNKFNIKYKELLHKINTGNEYMNKIVSELKINISKYSQTLKHLGKCPTCYSKISDSIITQILNELEGDSIVNN